MGADSNNKFKKFNRGELGQREEKWHPNDLEFVFHSGMLDGFFNELARSRAKN